jgi:ATP-dependent exoDNAse (exonuclease V) beta subunit
MPATVDAAEIPVEIISIDALGVRPSGRAFGKLVHAVLQSAKDAGECDAAAAVHSRRLRLTPADAKAAAEAARHTLDHPVLRHLAAMRQYREFPVLVRLDDGTLAEGAIDLACTDGASWIVIDYKTDIGSQSRYRRQLQLYGLALGRATDLPVRCLIVEV